MMASFYVEKLCHAGLLAAVVLAFPEQSIFAGSIERPAGVVPAHESKSTSGLSAGLEHSKSKLIPLRRKMTVASGSNPARVEQKNENKSASAPSAKSASAPSEASDVTQLKDPGVDATAAYEDVDPWDSAAKRFDQQDPARAVTKGVRVEDIIEPSSDYQYSGHRKKNPFIPALVLGRGSGAKDVNPNDVEIPIINPLQSFAASQLSVIGVWEGDDRVWKALIQTPANQGIETKLGDPAGNSGGRIMSISPEAVIVREFSVRADGTREYRDIPLYMGSDKPIAAEGNIGGRLILRPGATAPEIESPDSSIKRMNAADVAIPSGVSGKLSTLVPSVETLQGPVPESLAAPVVNSGGVFTAPVPVVPASSVPTSAEGGFK